MIFFPEYTTHNSRGDERVPYLKCGKWYLDDEQLSLTRLGILCKIDEEELLMLRLTYGG